MANLTVPIQVNLPDNWIDLVVERLRNDPEAEWITVTRCKDCKYYEIAELTRGGEDDKRYKPSVCIKGKYAVGRDKDWYCAAAERRSDE